MIRTVQAERPLRHWRHLLLPALLLAAAPAAAQEPDRFDVWDIALGSAVADLPAGAFTDHACGTDGGPPAAPLASAAEFVRCPADALGLHEVYLRYDDELEFWARAHDLPAFVERFAGTRVLIHPVILSILVTDAGLIAGIRIVTDPRAEPLQRQNAFLLGDNMKARFGRDGWACDALAAEHGETPLGDQFIKEECRKVTAEGTLLRLATRLLRKAGQTAVNPHTMQTQQGQFESTARLELWDLSLVPALAR